MELRGCALAKADRGTVNLETGCTSPKTSHFEAVEECHDDRQRGSDALFASHYTVAFGMIWILWYPFPNLDSEDATPEIEIFHDADMSSAFFDQGNNQL